MTFPLILLVIPQPSQKHATIKNCACIAAKNEEGKVIVCTQMDEVVQEVEPHYTKKVNQINSQLMRVQKIRRYTL